MCKDCHETIHDLFKNKELYEQFNELETLKAELKNRLVAQVFDGFDFLFEEMMREDGAVAPISEQPSCKRQVVGESPISALPELAPDLTFGSRL